MGVYFPHYRTNALVKVPAKVNPKWSSLDWFRWYVFGQRTPELIVKKQAAEKKKDLDTRFSRYDKYIKSRIDELKYNKSYIDLEKYILSWGESIPYMLNKGYLIYELLDDDGYYEYFLAWKPFGEPEYKQIFSLSDMAQQPIVKNVGDKDNLDKWLSLPIARRNKVLAEFALSFEDLENEELYQDYLLAIKSLK